VHTRLPLLHQRSLLHEELRYRRPLHFRVRDQGGSIVAVFVCEHRSMASSRHLTSSPAHESVPTEASHETDERLVQPCSLGPATTGAGQRDGIGGPSNGPHADAYAVIMIGAQAEKGARRALGNASSGLSVHGAACLGSAAAGDEGGAGAAGSAHDAFGGGDSGSGAWRGAGGCALARPLVRRCMGCAETAGALLRAAAYGACTPAQFFFFFFFFLIF
jgi:hypothetical protein